MVSANHTCKIGGTAEVYLVVFHAYFSIKQFNIIFLLSSIINGFHACFPIRLQHDISLVRRRFLVQLRYYQLVQCHMCRSGTD